jgi:hypothetical protein
MYKRVIETISKEKPLSMWGCRSVAGKVQDLSPLQIPQRAAPSYPQDSKGGERASDFQQSQGPGILETCLHSHCQMPILGIDLTYTSSEFKRSDSSGTE